MKHNLEKARGDKLHSIKKKKRGRGRDITDLNKSLGINQFKLNINIF